MCTSFNVSMTIFFYIFNFKIILMHLLLRFQLQRGESTYSNDGKSSHDINEFESTDQRSEVLICLLFPSDIINL